MTNPLEGHVRDQLLERRKRLQQATATIGPDTHLARLLREVDAALARFDEGSYGLCLTCHDPIEPERLLADPVLAYCLDHLTASQQRELEEDIELAARIQGALLPERSLRAAGWEIAFHYQGSGPTSGDYCDVVQSGAGALHFVLGDVSGKGLSASILMAHLHATFRALVSLDLPLAQLVARASRAFCESTLPSHYATLVCGVLRPTGELELCNAGHPSPLLLRSGNIQEIPSTGLPLGIFCDEAFGVTRLALRPGDELLLYTDGVTEAIDGEGGEYGAERLLRIARAGGELSPRGLVAACLDDLNHFRQGEPPADDVTLMAIRREG